MKRLRTIISRIPLAMLFLICGCPKPPPKVVDMTSYASCGAVTVTAENACAGQFTPEGLACVRCEEFECFDKRYGIYCVGSAGCLMDPRCKMEPGTIP